MSSIIRAAMSKTKTVGEGEDKQAMIALVRRAAELGKSTEAIERVKAGATVSDATAKTYAAACARRLDWDTDGGGDLLAGVSASSWHATRAALRWGAARAWLDARRASDKAQKAGDVAGATMWAGRAVVMGEALEVLDAAERPTPTKRRATKRATMPKGDNWQARVFDAATPAQRPAVAVLWATGCRPAELEKGVDVMRSPAGALVVRIPGAKVSDKAGAGQPVRVLVIDESTEAGKALSGLLGKDQKRTIQRRAERLNKDFATIRGKIGGTASPYSMRHQIAANLKAEAGPDGADKVAETLGHRTTRSQSRYGSVRQAQAGGSGVVKAAATHKIKETRPGRRPSAPKQTRPEASGPGF
jgi:hypothetical protein